MKDSPVTDYNYVGGELELFAEARHWKRYLLETAGEFIRGDVLEVGAGIGGTTRVFCAGRESSWTCLEPDHHLAESLRLGFAESPLPVQPSIRTEFVQDLSERDLFDTILYVDVLEHIEDDRKELTAATLHLRSRGHLIVIGPAHQWLFSAFDVAVGHHRRYSRGTLAAAMPELMNSRLLRYLDCLGMALSAVNRMILRSESPSRRQIGFWDHWVVPFSKRLDPLLGWRVGKSVVGVWQKP
jgi:hypothetical protein